MRMVRFVLEEKPQIAQIYTDCIDPAGITDDTEWDDSRESDSLSRSVIAGLAESRWRVRPVSPNL